MEERIEATQDGRRLVIRKARPEDAEALIEAVNVIAGETDFLSFGAGQFWLTVDEERKLIERHLESDNHLFLVAWIDDAIVGVTLFMGGSRERIRHCGDVGLNVARPFWNQGVGSRLLDALIDSARRSPVVTRLDLQVRTDNTWAIHLYRKKGFRIEGTLSDRFVVEGRHYDHHCMGLDVRTPGDLNDAGPCPSSKPIRASRRRERRD